MISGTKYKPDNPKMPVETVFSLAKLVTPKGTLSFLPLLETKQNKFLVFLSLLLSSKVKQNKSLVTSTLVTFLTTSRLAYTSLASNQVNATAFELVKPPVAWQIKSVSSLTSNLASSYSLLEQNVSDK